MDNFEKQIDRISEQLSELAKIMSSTRSQIAVLAARLDHVAKLEEQVKEHSQRLAAYAVWARVGGAVIMGAAGAAGMALFKVMQDPVVADAVAKVGGG